MALKSNFNSVDSMRDVLRQADQNIYPKLIRSAIRAGEDFVKSAREQVQSHKLGTYMDQSTNLRNSIGYFVFHNGDLVMELGNEHPENLRIVRELVSQRGIQLIGIAGMNYASWVEAKGYNVISFQADQCMVDLTMYLTAIGLMDTGSGARLEDTFLP